MPQNGRSLKRWILWVAGGLIIVPCLLVALLLGGLYTATLLSARDGDPMILSEPTAARRSTPSIRPEHQILFGDLHVHTNYSADSFLQSYKIPNLDLRRTPADACDFARFCSQLDFWSVNDHAESLTPAHWKATLDAVRACESTAGDPSDPDLVSFLGWEWSHADTVEKHYGHKNIILADLDDDDIPARPIASAAGAPWPFLALGTAGALMSPLPYSDYASFHRYAIDVLDVPDCSNDRPSPELPTDCRESATTPRELFRKLDEWEKRALVIPHGLAWGTTNPPGARLDVQLEQHDPKWQRLLEVYSGHGNSEIYSDFERPQKDEAGEWSCPAPSEDITFCCQRASILARRTCADPESSSCDALVAEAVQEVAALDAGYGFGKPTDALPSTTLPDWGDCSQLRGEFLSAWNYRPKQSAQYALALGSVDERAVPDRFRFGLMASSDTHRGRPGTGYKEKGRLVMTDGVGYPMPEGAMDDRQSSFYFSGGLVAAHATSRNRNDVFDALSERAVYGTSGDRILLWFDLVSKGGERQPMGSEIALNETPNFEVRAVGARKQKPGCPDFVQSALSPERIESLCLGECFNPSDERKRIERIEVVRIQPQVEGTEAVADRIEDPWRAFDCEDVGEGCLFAFDDPDFVQGDRESVYYVRAIQEASPAINGDSLRCEREEDGLCLRSTPCEDGGGERPDDCLSPTQERAWSSPIFLLPNTNTTAAAVEAATAAIREERS